MAISESPILYYVGDIPIIIYDNLSDICAIEMRFLAWSSYETHLKNNGVAHFLEHMLTKWWWEYITEDDVRRAIHKIWWQTNATTGKEHMYFYGKVPKKHNLDLLRILLSTVFKPTLDKQRFEIEKKIILQEIEKGYKDPQRIAYNTYINWLYPNSSMGTPNMWTYEDVLNLKYEDVLEYYQYFLTSPCVITIAWDCLELKEFIYATIEEYCFDTKFKYHVLQNYTLTNEKVFKPVAYSNPNSVFFHSRIEWFWARDEYRYLTQAIVNKVLWLWAHSRLYRHIRSEMGYCYSISTGLNNFQKETYIELSWNSKLDHIPYIQDYFQNQFFQLISWWIWREEFDDAKESLLLSIPYRYETSSNIVTKINKRFLETWLIRDKKRYYDQLSCIEYEDIRRVFDWISVECKHFSI